MQSEKCVEDIHEQVLELRDEARRHGIPSEKLARLLMLHGEELADKGFAESPDHSLEVRGGGGALDALLSD